MPRPLAFKVLTAGTYLPINRIDVSFVTLNGAVMYLGHGCFLARDKSKNIYLAFGHPEVAMMVPEGTIVGVHFADGEGDDEDIEFLAEDLSGAVESEPAEIDEAALEALKRMFDGDSP